MRHVILTLAVPIVLSLASGAPAAAKTIDVVASFSVLADVAQQVGGEHVRVKSLVPPEGDPHEYEPSPDDARAIREAAVTLVSGNGFESWFDQLAKAAGASRPPVVVSTGIATHDMEEDGETATDPHVWNDAANVLVWVDNIEAALIAADPEDAADIKASAAAYRTQLRALDAEIRAAVEAVPAERRKVLTSHDAFGYYQVAYGVTFLAPLGLSTELEASAADVAALIDQIKAEGVKVYFLENSNDSRLTEQIAAATGAVLGGELYPELLSAADGPAASYLDLMRYNTAQIVRAIAQ